MGNQSGFRPGIDRANWTVESMTETEFSKMYDVHLLAKIYRPDNWNKTIPLLNLMYGPDSSEKLWATNYAREFFNKVKSYANLAN